MKKAKQLGMNPSTAQNRLTKDILFKLICEAGKNFCYHCKEEITRETLSIEHKTPWLDSKDPVGLFFDLDNIAFSHLSCNAAAARKDGGKCGTIAQYRRGCRCDACREIKSKDNCRNYNPNRKR